MEPALGQLVRGHRRNAALSWLLVCSVVLAIGVSLYGGDLLWGAFALVVAALTVLPPVLLRSPSAMLPWEVTALCALPVLGRAFSTVPVTGQVAMYLAVAAIALVITVELDLFTSVRMTDSFAVALVAVATMAAAGFWAVARWTLDVLFDTEFLLDPARSQAAIEHDLMIEFVASTAAGLVAGLLFTFYVRRRIERDVRPPDGVSR